MPVIKKLALFVLCSAAVVLFAAIQVYAVSERIGYVTEDAVNFRASPNTSSKILQQLKKGTKVTVIGSEGEWFKVSYSDATGWINDNYLIIRDENISVGVVSGDVVNVRSKPDTSAEILAKLAKGMKVEIFEHSGDWCRISIGEARYGWIHGDYLRVQETKVSRGTAEGRGTADAAKTAKTGSTASAGIRQKIVEYAKTLLGIRYRYGGTTTKGFDCSGFVGYVFKKFGISLDRTSAEMGNGGKPVKKAELEPGDLVFFDTNGGLNRINHVGIYIGDGKFIHASSSYEREVKISSLYESFYSKTYMRARDYLD